MAETVQGIGPFTASVPQRTTEKKEAVNHPDHYGGKDNPYEVVKVLENWLTREEFIGALKFNIIKYVGRANKKNGAQDYEKAAWYSAYLKDFLTRNPL